MQHPQRTADVLKNRVISTESLDGTTALMHVYYEVAI